MKRFHIHVGVEKLDESIRFYSALFGAEPVKTKTDYAKWLLEEPRVNFAISTRAKKKRRRSPWHPGRGKERTDRVARTLQGWGHGRCRGRRNRLLLCPVGEIL